MSRISVREPDLIRTFIRKTVHVFRRKSPVCLVYNQLAHTRSCNMVHPRSWTTTSFQLSTKPPNTTVYETMKPDAQASVTSEYTKRRLKRSSYVGSNRLRSPFHQGGKQCWTERLFTQSKSSVVQQPLHRLNI